RRFRLPRVRTGGLQWLRIGTALQMAVSMSQVIINRGRGPEIAGTRITVYDVLDYSTKGYHPAFIASLFRVSSEQVVAALEYIEAHKDEVMAEYQQMRARDAEGNPPEVRT